MTRTSNVILKHWWGRGNPLDVEIDFRAPRYRFVEHAKDGNSYAFRGEPAHTVA